MPVFGSLPRRFATLIILTLLAACQSSEEQAADHFASAQELIAAGDPSRAIVELRNALALKSDLHEARRTLADTLLASGDLATAYQQYSDLAERQPNDLESRIAIATILLSQSAWTEFDAVATVAESINATDPRVINLTLARDYQQAINTDNTTLRDQIAARAAELRATQPEDPALLRIAIDQSMQEGDSPLSLQLIEAALAQQPIDYGLQEAKLRLLLADADPAQVEAQYKSMIALFPTDQQLPSNLLQWYLSREDLAGAEGFLRERAGLPTAAVDGHIAVIEFLRATQGPDAALAEIQALITANEGDSKANLYRATQASILFENGDRDRALSEIATVLTTATASDQTRRIKALYANMLTSMGDRTGAEKVVAEILAEDASHVEALFLRASWRIADDLASEAIIDLRSALNQDPNNPRLLAALSSAYLRDGAIDLATDTLGQAADAAPLDPAYARAYARLLLDQGRTDVARSVLYSAWQANLADVGLVEMLSAWALNQSDWTLAAELIGTLRTSDARVALSSANQLEIAVLAAQERYDEALALLDTEIALNDDNSPWILLKIDTLIRADRRDDAVDVLATALATKPEDRSLLLRKAAFETEDERPDAAIALYRSVLAANPTDDFATRQLYALLMAQEQPAEAIAVLDAGLAARPTSVELRWIQASRLQDAGDLQGAIGVYETLYAEDSTNAVIANNLASLLSQTATDQATIDRAMRIARRFRASEVPAFQDTYGWLLHLTGNSAAALPLLEAAAAALAEDASVQYHLGAVLAASGRIEEARAKLEGAIALAADTQTAYADRASTLLQELDATPPQPAPQAAPEPAPQTEPPAQP